MANIFEPIELTWQGKTYTIQPDQVMRLLQALESEGFSLAAIGQMRAEMQMARLSKAFALILRMAGARGVSELDVYGALMEGLADDSEKVAVTMSTAFSVLEAMFVPPSLAAKKKPAPAVTKKATKKKTRRKS